MSSNEKATQVQRAAETVAAPGAHGEVAARRATEDGVPAVWNVGNILLDLYEVKGILGEGGMGTVYRVHHRGWNLDLAVKSPKAEVLANAGGAENFAREAETWVNLGLHPHTVSCYYVRTLGGIPRVFAEYIEGGSLSERIYSRRLYEGGPETALERILDIAIQFAWGLDYAHEQGLIHQDVKPANVMMSLDGTAKVTDFGLTRARGRAGAAPGEGTPGGTLLAESGGMTAAYASPEQARGEPLSRKTDLWSWAVSVLEMFTGEVTWLSGLAAPDALQGYLETRPDDAPLSKMPKSITELLTKCFAEDPQGRPQGMQDVAQALEASYERLIAKAYRREKPKAAKLTADSLNNRALSYLDLGKLEEADKTWDAALSNDPQHLESSYNHGLTLWRRGKLTDELLVQQLESIRASQPGDWRTLHLLANVHLERADTEAALQLLKGAVSSAPRGSEVHQAFALACSGEIAAARCQRAIYGHKDRVLGARMSADARIAVSRSVDGSLRIWDLTQGRELRHEWFSTHVESVALSDDGRFAVSGVNPTTLQLFSDKHFHYLGVWDIDAGRCLLTLKGHTDRIKSVDLSADHSRALSGSSDQTVRLWDVTSPGFWPRRRCLHVLTGHVGAVLAVRLRRNAALALSGGSDCTVRVWETVTGRCVQTLEGHSSAVTSVSLSDDGRLAISGSRDRSLRLWDLTSSACLRVLSGHESGVTAVCLSRNGLWAFSGGEDGSLRLWELKTGRCLRTLKGHSNTVTSVSLSRGDLLALSASDDKSLRLWELPREAREVGSFCLSRIQSHSESLEFETRAVGLVRAIDTALGALRFADALRLARELRAVPGHERSERSLETWARVSSFCRRTELLGAWPVATFEGHTAGVRSAGIDADARWVISGGDDKTLRLWEVATRSCVRVFEGHTGVVGSVSLSRDGSRALSGGCGFFEYQGGDKTLRLWDVASGRCVRRFEGHEGSVFAASLSRDGRWALSGSGNPELSDDMVRFWDAKTGQCLRMLEGHEAPVTTVAFSRDARLGCSGGWDNKVRVWDLANARCLHVLAGHDSFVNSVCFSADGRTVLSASGNVFSDSGDQSLRLWDVSTGRCLATLGGHKGPILSACLTFDGRFALSGSKDQTLRLIEVRSGTTVCTLDGHKGPVCTVCLSPDDRWAISGSEDRTVRLWALDWELEACDSADWDDGALPYVESFPNVHAVAGRLPSWDEANFGELMRDLQHAGYGWLRPEGVREHLRRVR